MLLSAGGCAFLEVRAQQERFEVSARFQGTVATDSPRAHPLVVVLARWEGESLVLVDHFVRDRPGAFFFTAAAGRYVVSAFEDTNANLRYEPDEPAIPLSDAPTIDATVGEVVSNIELVVRSDRRAGFAESIDVSALIARTHNDQMNVSFGHVKVRGEVAPLADPRFALENGGKGLWEPFDFLLEVGAGIYFLQPYEPGKTPVLFVHGMGGSPREFAHLIANLDRSRFQPWVFYYPSGTYVERVAGHLLELVVELRIRHRFERVVVVAHSMGGLLSRAFIMQREAAGGETLVSPFVSISTPWGGHASAQQGVDRAPVVVYSWEDMAPKSSFLRELFARPLPDDLCHHLIFGYERNELRPGASSDKVIDVSSQLRFEAQREARSVYGIEADHASILRSAETSMVLNELLELPCP
jgi:pimeloyl-ACP methyl ester carboxylesterase